MITIKMNTINVQDYLEIRAKVGWIALQEKQATKALEHSICVIGAYDDDRLIGMGRIVGDGAVICYIQDLIVTPEYQSNGVGSMLLQHLIDYVKGLSDPDSRMMLCLMCAKGREQFYEKHGFIARPTDNLGPGMIQYLVGDEYVEIKN